LLVTHDVRAAEYAGRVFNLQPPLASLPREVPDERIAPAR
jgi:hypothetical protein